MSQPVRLPIHVLILALVAVVVLRAGAQATGKTVIGNSTATLSPATRVGDLIFVSGQLGGRDSTIQGQTSNALNSIKAILEGAGSSMANVAKCTVFLVDFKDFPGMNQSYSAAFPKEPPARSTVIVTALVSAVAKVELECIASAR